MTIEVAVVDDEDIALRLFQMSFKKEIKEKKINLHTFAEPEKLMDFLKESEKNKDIVFILSDINMPKIDGFEVLKRVKSLYPHIKVVMESAYGNQEIIDKAFALGADDYVTKPIDFDRVKEIIFSYLR